MNLTQSALFFAKLRKLTVTLETETDKLRAAFENRNSDSDSESTTRGMRAYDELNYEVINMKGQIQDQVAQQKAGMDEVSSFLKNYDVMLQKLLEDINILKGHWEKYGFQVPKNTKTANQEALNENENQQLEEEEGNHKESGEESSFEKPVVSVADCLRTPQLCDFGLSEDQLKRALTGAKRCSEVPPMPKMSLLHPSLNTPVPPFMAITPKPTLQMGKDELLTPQMNDFGISKHTMCLNNDFTMARRQKHFGKPQKPQENLEPPVNSLMESLKAKDSPEPPVFRTPGLKIKKTHVSTSVENISDLESPSYPANMPPTPEVPAFQTPYMNRLISTKKSQRKPEPIKMQKPTPPHVPFTSKRIWECDVPDLLVEHMDDQIPEMPNLESNLGNSLQTRSAKMRKKVSGHENPTFSPLDLDGPTQEFNLETPCVRRVYEELSTPEMPDLSSVTQDICKVRAYLYSSENILQLF